MQQLSKILGRSRSQALLSAVADFLEFDGGSRYHSIWEGGFAISKVRSCPGESLSCPGPEDNAPAIRSCTSKKAPLRERDSGNRYGMNRIYPRNV